MLSPSSNSSSSGKASKSGCLPAIMLLLSIGSLGCFIDAGDPSTYLDPFYLLFPVATIILFIVHRYKKHKQSIKLTYYTPESSSDTQTKDSAGNIQEFSEFDESGRPLRDITRVRLSGYSKTHFYNNAQEAIEKARLYDWVLVEHDEANPVDEHAIYITNSACEYMGWIPNTKRYAEFKKDLCRLIRESDPPAIDARVCDLLYGDGDYIKCEVEIARYGEAPEAPQAPKKVKDPAAEIAKYKSLLDSGAITQEEYDAKKKQLLEI